jgi:hypothetical protein
MAGSLARTSLDCRPLRGVAMAGVQRYYLNIEDLAHARGTVPALSFQGDSPEGLGAALSAALREPALWQRWLALQPDPDAVDPALGATDPAATVTARLADESHTDVVVTTRLPHAIVRHRLNLLVGAHWTLRDVKAA